MIKVCDALCGFGKTSACIKMMNEETDKKFIFVTQFLSEVDRIKAGCSARKFVSPCADPSTNKTKLADIHSLLREGLNIATTHALFISYTDETKDLIRKRGYTLVLDESVDVLDTAEIAECDMDILRRSSAIRESDDGNIEWLMDSYGLTEEHGKFREEMLRAKSKNFLKFEDQFFFWSIPPELFTCFSDIYVLTYMFIAQPLKCFFDIHEFEYELIGVKHSEDGYVFCGLEEMDRTVELRDKIHILDNKKLNAIGGVRTALSFSWYKSAYAEEGSPQLDKLRKNISNVFKNIYKAAGKDTLWTCFKQYTSRLRGNGYNMSFIPYNLRASNEYADRHYLAYCVNNFPRPMEKRYYQEHGTDLDADMYALSILVQWVFRSAIRKKEEIWLYVPSARMRYLLTAWLDNLAVGQDLTPISYKTPRKSRAKPGAKRGRPPMGDI